MKNLIFDSGPIISLAMARLLWILEPLKKKYGGKFYITPAVKKELVERPLNIRRFEFEALQVMKLIRDGVLEVYTDVPKKEVKELMDLANQCFSIKNRTLEIIQEGEMEVAIIYERLDSEAVVMDERTMRLLIENPEEVRSLLERRFKSKVTANKAALDSFGQKIEKIKIIRSVELVGTAYKFGILDSYIPQLKDGRKVLLDAVLWNTKFNGAAVTQKEIEDIKNYLLK